MRSRRCRCGGREGGRVRGRVGGREGERERGEEDEGLCVREQEREGPRSRSGFVSIEWHSCRPLTGSTSAGVSTNASTAESKIEACSALWRARASTEGSSGGGEEGRGDAAEVADGDEDDATIDDDRCRFRARFMTAADALSLLLLLAGQQRDAMDALIVRGSIVMVSSRRKETREF